MIPKQILKKTISKLLNAKPTMYSSSVILNILGAQLFRIGFLYCRRVARLPKSIPAQLAYCLEELEEKGIVAIPNFFSNEDCAKIREEYHRLSPEFRKDESEIPLPHVCTMNIRDKRVSTWFRDLFAQNPLVRAIPTAFLNRKFNLPLEARLTRIFCNQEELDLPKNGGTNNIHFDAPTRVLKAFYYLSDTDENNAALYYCLGSQKRNSLKRLLFEYKLSVRYALNRWNPEHGGEYVSDGPWVKITEEEMRKHGLKEAAVAVKGNTLVFANVGGFHRRGAFLKPGARETIEINYRGIETLRNEFDPLIQKVKRLI